MSDTLNGAWTIGSKRVSDPPAPLLFSISLNSDPTKEYSCPLQVVQG